MLWSDKEQGSLANFSNNCFCDTVSSLWLLFRKSVSSGFSKRKCKCYTVNVTDVMCTSYQFVSLHFSILTDLIFYNDLCERFSPFGYSVCLAYMYVHKVSEILKRILTHCRSRFKTNRSLNCSLKRVAATPFILFFSSNENVSPLNP